MGVIRVSVEILGDLIFHRQIQKAAKPTGDK